jgi:ABC-type branched-subunit amino acid transport system substrate-binding protein
MAENNGHHFRATLEREDETNDPDNTAALAFDVQHHEDILAIAERLRSGTASSVSDANALAVGLKLFTGVMLAHRQAPCSLQFSPQCARSSAT